MIMEFTAEVEDAGLRCDVFLSTQSGLTRSRVQKLIAQGFVLLDGEPVTKTSLRVKPEQEFVLDTVPIPTFEAVAQDIPLDILFEDTHVIVINKPQGMVVHPAAGHPDGTLVNALLYHCKEFSTSKERVRPGIVHRLDKDTSGVMVAAKTDLAEAALSEQLKNKTAGRIYLAIVEGTVKEHGQVNAPIGRHPKDRKRMAVVPNGRSAITDYTVLATHMGKSLLQCSLQTGRTHQIRVHMAHIGHPVVNDPLYGIQKQKATGQYLHAYQLHFLHPQTQQPVSFTAPPPENFVKMVQKLKLN